MAFQLLAVILFFIGGSKCDRNIALGKRAFQSSNPLSHHQAAYAVDGNYTTFSETGKDIQSWWMVDLRTPENLSHIIINFGDNNFTDAEVELSLSGEDWSIATGNSSNYRINTYSVTSNDNFRYVKVRHSQENQSISLFEVEIYRQIFTPDQKLHLPLKPSFVSEWHVIRSQSLNDSELKIHHGLREMPVKVIADIKVTYNGEEYLFHGFGAAQTDDDESNKYGGVIVVYNENEVLLIAPNAKNDELKRGRAIYIGSRNSWEGPDIEREYEEALVRVRIWILSDLPKPSFISPWYFVSSVKDKNRTTYREIEHFMNRYPDLVSLQVKIKLHYRTYVFEGQGSSSVIDVKTAWSSTSGAVYGYNNKSVRVWFPYGKFVHRHAPKGYVFFASDGWGNVNFKVNKGHYRVMTWRFQPEPVYTTTFSTLTHEIALPVQFPFHLSFERLLINVQFEVKEGTHTGFRFQGVGSSMHDGRIQGQYGGLIYSFTDSKALFWIPSSSKQYYCGLRRDCGYIFNIGGIWGYGKLPQKTNSVDFRIEMFNLFDEEDITCKAGKDEFPYKTLEKEHIAYKSIMKSNCPSGTKHRSGSISRVCQRNGHWSGLPLFCKDIECPTDTLKVMHTTHIMSGLKVNDTITYECQYGYQLNAGDLTRTCQLSGNWDGVPPLCTEIKCPVDYLHVENASYQITGFKLDDAVKYECQTGFRHYDGNITRTCKGDSMWSGQAPVCIEIVCAVDHLQITYASYNLTGTTLGDSVKYKCNFGYRHSAGNLTRTCQLDGIWSGETPLCSEVECRTDFLNSSMTLANVTGNSFMDVAVFQCPENHYKIGGSDYRLCQLDSTWSGSSLLCKRCRCPCLKSKYVMDISLQEELVKLKEELIVNKRKLSSFVRKKNCAEDNRPVAKGLGIVGAIVIVVCIMLVVVPDVPLLNRHCKAGIKNISHRCKRNRSKKYILVPLNDIEVKATDDNTDSVSLHAETGFP